MKIPRAYKRSAKTKLLWLYKVNLITRKNYTRCINLNLSYKSSTCVGTSENHWSELKKKSRILITK